MCTFAAKKFLQPTLNMCNQKEPESQIPCINVLMHSGSKWNRLKQFGVTQHQFHERLGLRITCQKGWKIFATRNVFRKSKDAAYQRIRKQRFAFRANANEINQVSILCSACWSNWLFDHQCTHHWCVQMGRFEFSLTWLFLVPWASAKPHRFQQNLQMIYWSSPAAICIFDLEPKE